MTVELTASSIISSHVRVSLPPPELNLINWPPEAEVSFTAVTLEVSVADSGSIVDDVDAARLNARVRSPSPAKMAIDNAGFLADLILFFIFKDDIPNG